jgi:serine/threonine protein kinase
MDADSWRQAKSVLEAALMCAPAEREAFVAGRCADAWLRHEVLACLNEHDEGFLESALTISNTFDNAMSTDDVEPPPDVQSGERIAGRYEIVRRLGVGGMGAVFLARDIDLERQVALKFLIAAASAADIRARIFHEARAAARIIHPNIALVYEVGVHEGRAFMVMEYVEGENLAQRLKRERPPLEMILAVGRQLASALTAAHDKGIIHRDLKPANIQIARDGSAKILDFGVAHAMASVDESDGGTTAVAPAGTLMTLSTRTERGAIRHPGTPAYMSPEQMFGKPIDGRSDIYSLGVILYEMATGHRPYSTDDPLDVVLALSHKLLRPSGTETHLPEAVNDVIGKMLAVELDERYQTAGEVENALVALMAPEPLPDARSRWKRVVVQVAARVIRVAARVGLLSVLSVASITSLGFLETQAFNFTLGRVAPFNNEPTSEWLRLGLSSIFVPGLYLVGVLLFVSAGRFAVRVLSLSRGIDQLLTKGVERTNRIGSRLGLEDPAVLGQAVAGVGVLSLTALIWHFWPFISAAATVSISTKPAEQFLELRPSGHGRLDAQLYQFCLVVLIFCFGGAIVRIVRLRAQVARKGGSALALVTAMLVFASVICVWPYRLEWKNDMARVDVAGERCFLLGEHDEDMLLHCPEAMLPRNRIVKRADPAVRDLGKLQSIFSPLETSP